MATIYDWIAVRSSCKKGSRVQCIVSHGPFLSTVRPTWSKYSIIGQKWRSRC